ncbi:TPA: toxin Cry1Ac domain D-VI-related protein, partial [Enterococcus faecalis]
MKKKHVRKALLTVAMVSLIAPTILQPMTVLAESVETPSSEKTEETEASLDEKVTSNPEGSVDEETLKDTKPSDSAHIAIATIINPTFEFDKEKLIFEGWQVVKGDGRLLDGALSPATMRMGSMGAEVQHYAYMPQNTPESLYIAPVNYKTVGLQQAIQTEVGKTYQVEISVENVRNIETQIRLTNDAVGTNIITSQERRDTGKLVARFTANSTETYLNILARNWQAYAAIFSNLSIREVSPEELATEDVTALFRNDTKDALADGVDQAKIDAATALVDALPDSETKTELLTLVTRARGFLEAQTQVTALFKTPDTEIKEGLTQAEIDAAKATVTALMDGAWKTEQLARIQVAQGLFDDKQQEDARNAVLSLFKDNNPETNQLAEGTTKEKINAARGLVEALKDGEEKETLRALIKKAQVLLFLIVNPTFEFDKEKLTFEGWQVVKGDGRLLDGALSPATMRMGSRGAEVPSYAYMPQNTPESLYIAPVNYKTVGLQQAIQTEVGKTYQVEISVENVRNIETQIRLTNDAVGTNIITSQERRDTGKLVAR